MRWRVTPVVLLFLWPIVAVGDVGAGRDLAIKWCSKCHVIGKYNFPYGGINSTPSFFIMAEKPEVYLPKVLSVQERRPHAALSFSLDARELEDIKTYIATLERK